MLKATNEKYKKDEILRISMLVQKGNHLHNLEVVRQKRGYLVVARANTKNTNHSWNEFLPCAFCKSWILKHLFTKHRQFCNFTKLGTSYLSQVWYLLSNDHFQPKMSHLKLSKLVFNEEMDKLGARLSAPKSAPEIKKRYYNGTVFSEKETNLIIEYFQFFINNKITPRKGQILPFIIENKFENVSWTWKDIKNEIVTKIYNEKKKEEILERRKEKKLVPFVAQEVNSESVSKIYKDLENLENIEYFKDEFISNRDNKYDTKLEVTETLPKPMLFADSKGNLCLEVEANKEKNEVQDQTKVNIVTVAKDSFEINVEENVNDLEGEPETVVKNSKINSKLEVESDINTACLDQNSEMYSFDASTMYSTIQHNVKVEDISEKETSLDIKNTRIIKTHANKEEDETEEVGNNTLTYEGFDIQNLLLDDETYMLLDGKFDDLSDEDLPKGQVL